MRTQRYDWKREKMAEGRRNQKSNAQKVRAELAALKAKQQSRI